MVLMCSCGRWMIREYVTDKSGMVCSYYDYCPRCEENKPNGFDDYGNPVHYCYG